MKLWRCAMVAFVVMLGMTMLGAGPRASAAFWSALTPPSDGGSCGASITNDYANSHSPCVWPPTNRTLALDLLMRCTEGVDPGGAGRVPTSSSSNSNSTSAMSDTSSSLVLALLIREGLQLPEFEIAPSPFVSSIFEPPRIG